MLHAFLKFAENLQVIKHYFRLLFLMKAKLLPAVCLLLLSCQAHPLLFPFEERISGFMRTGGERSLPASREGRQAGANSGMERFLWQQHQAIPTHAGLCGNPTCCGVPSLQGVSQGAQRKAGLLRKPWGLEGQRTQIYRKPGLICPAAHGTIGLS